MPAAATPLEGLTFDRLRRMQATLERRSRQRDAANILSVGFAPQLGDRPVLQSSSSLPITAQFDVQQKLLQVPPEKRIAQVESLRLLDRATGQFQHIALATDIDPRGTLVPTGVRVALDGNYATSSLVVRWTKVEPVPRLPTAEQPDDPRWRWGLLSVAHVFSLGDSSRRAQAQVERRISCGSGPAHVVGEVIASGRIPGGPDIGLVETGLDRLWLSGMLSRPDAPPIAPASEAQLLRWVSQGTTGSFLADGSSHAWQWQTFYPELAIAKLGKLQHIIRYRSVAVAEAAQPPFGPGSSGGVLVAGGIPIAVQVAAMAPDFTVGFAQSLDVSLGWLKLRLRASALQLVQLLVD